MIRPLATVAATSAALVLLLAGCVGQTPAPVESPSATPIPGAIACTDAEPEVIDMTGSTWQHPQNSFYEGTEEVIPTEYDLEHLLRSDNAIVVIYDREALPEAAILPLKEWIYLETAAVAIPSTDAPRAPIEVRLAGSPTVKLCDGVDIIQLSTFSASRTPGNVQPHGEEGTDEGTEENAE